jgi:pimeloyl-ACP methyl ester carboxylesterase
LDIEKHFEEKGSGPPIVFIHGSYATTSTWKRIVDRLATTNRCISIKLPGHCGTPDPEDFSNPTIETELTILEHVVGSLTDEPIHLVGHSFGGVIALAQALKGNLPISQVSLFEPVAVWVLDVVHDEPMLARLNSFLARYRDDVAHNRPYACGQVLDFWGGEGSFEPLPDFIKQGMVPLVDNNIRHWDIGVGIDSQLSDLQACTIPTRLICGTESNPVARAICDHLGKLLPVSKNYTIEGASHFMVTTHISECLDALGDQSLL